MDTPAFTGFLRLAVVTLAISLPTLACEKKETKADAVLTKTTTQFAAGEKVDVEWNSKWWQAEILEAKDGTYRVHYVGWNASWDENVGPNRVRARTGTSSIGNEQPNRESASPTESTTAETTTTAAKTWKAGDKVDVEWNKEWWQGQVLIAKDGQYKVHYVGWASSWDETVPASRLRAPTPSAKRGTGD